MLQPDVPFRRRRAAATTALALALTLVAAACGSGSPDSASSPNTVTQGNDNAVETEDAPTAGGKLTYGLIAETNGWNPGSSQWAPSGQQVAKTIFDTLSAFDADSNIQPFLAERFEHNDDFTQWRIVLRDGIKLHNGKDVTSDTVRRNQQYLKDSPLTASVFDTIEKFSTDGPKVVVVDLKERWVNYPNSLATQIGVVGDPDWMESKDTQKPIGTGPFKLDQWIIDKSMKLTKNQDYWQKGYPLFDSLEYQPIPDDTTRAQALDAGDIDIMEVGSAKEIARFKNRGDANDFQVFNATSGETSEVFVMMNTMAPPFDDIAARQALVAATDSESYNVTLNEGLFTVAKGPFVPSSKWYTDTGYTGYDPARAQTLVDEVKAKHGGQFSITLTGPPTPNTQEGLQLLKQQWEAVGISVEIKTYDQLTLIVKIISGDYQASIWQQFDSPHPLGDSIWWHPRTAHEIGSKETSLNFARNKDDEIGKALDLARQTDDPAIELEQYKIVQRRLTADLPYVWLYHSQISIVASNQLVNVTNYKLPSGARGLPIQGGAHPVWQIWRKPAPAS